MAKTIGLYLGVNSLAVAQVAGRNLLHLNTFNLSALDDSKTEAVNEDIRLEALFNKAIREVSIEGDNVYLSLADKDFIFRLLEMPFMRKAEIESSLVYEVEKYIPFKITELEWTYASMRSAKEKKMSIAFVGIRDRNLTRIRDVLGRLGLNPVFIEPSALSLARAIKARKKFFKINDYTLLDLTENESHLTFFQKDLPVFNRYLSVPKKDNAFDVTKFAESVDFSFQYFKREFRSYRLDKFIIVSDIENNELAPNLKEELQVDVETVSAVQITGRANATVEGAKALGVALKDRHASLFVPGFQKTRVTQEGDVAELAGAVPALRIGLIGSLLGAGLILALFLSLVMGNELSLREVELQKERESVVVPEGLKQFSAEQYPETIKGLEVKIRGLKTTLQSFHNLSGPLGALSSKKVLPDGLWVENFRISRQGQNYAGKLTGYIFRDNDYQERLALDEFVSRIKNESSLQEIFQSIEVDFSKRQKKKDFEVTYFSITLR